MTIYFSIAALGLLCKAILGVFSRCTKEEEDEKVEICSHKLFFWKYEV